MNTQLIPPDPEEKVKLWLTMLEMVKAQIAAGILTSDMVSAN
jgi:hypothetical protein